MSGLSLTNEIMHKIYGPKFCGNCSKLSNVITYKLQGSDYTELDGTILTFKFMGAQYCADCFKAIEPSPTK